MRGTYQRDLGYIPSCLNVSMKELEAKWKHMSQAEVECWAKVYEKALGETSKVTVTKQIGSHTVRVFNFNPKYFTASMSIALFCELWFLPVEDMTKLISDPDLLVRSIVVTRVRDNL